MKQTVLSAAAAALFAALLPSAGSAADPSGGPVPRSRDFRAATYSTYSPLGPACQEHSPYDDNLLRCPAQIQIRPPEGDVLAWNDLVRIKPQRKPYRELFSWTP